jgi:transposase
LPHEKVAAVKRHLLERVPISAIREELKIAPNMFHRWQQELFENAHPSFETDRTSKAIEATKDRKIEQLESKLQRNNEVLAELMQEHVPLKKKNLASPEQPLGSPRNSRPGDRLRTPLVREVRDSDLPHAAVGRHRRRKSP